MKPKKIIPDCHDENLEKKFYRELEEFLDKWSEKNCLESNTIIRALMAELKIEACYSQSCYYCMIGFLTEVLHAGGEEMFNDLQKVKKEVDEEILTKRKGN